MKVFYDAKCVVCDLEIGAYRKKCSDRNDIEFIDITSEDFDAEMEGLDPKAVHEVFHVKKGGQIIQGVDGFIAIWESINSLKFLSRLAKKPLIRSMLDASYKVFVKIRPALPRRD